MQAHGREGLGIFGVPSRRVGLHSVPENRPVPLPGGEGIRRYGNEGLEMSGKGRHAWMTCGVCAHRGHASPKAPWG